MSRIGKLSIKIPPKVEVEIEIKLLHVSGPHGQLSREISDLILLNTENQEISIIPKR